ncbi:MAG TPA: histidine triad nucleotide-binding protein [Nitrospiraceae bacterium]|nr:histidine triad nucleotide-binding protein [Nitrospiraceae bacterium]
MSDCLFCKIVDKKIPSKIIHEDDKTVAFEDINPQAPVHVLVVPKRHAASIADLNAADAGLLGHLMLTGATIAKQKGIADSGYRLVLNTGRNGGQTVFHLHVHLLGGRPMHWPPG